MSPSDNPETIRMIEFTRFIREKKKFELRTIMMIDDKKIEILIGELDMVLERLEEFSITCILTREIQKDGQAKTL